LVICRIGDINFPTSIRPVSEMLYYSAASHSLTSQHSIRLCLGHEAFGVKSKSGSEPAKALIFPTNVEETSDAIDLYKRSHGSYAPGEQKRRDYNWSVDPDRTRFGAKGDTIAFNGVSKNIADVLNGSSTSPVNGVVNTKKVRAFEPAI
jgi:hypothetical protein